MQPNALVITQRRQTMYKEEFLNDDDSKILNDTINKYGCDPDEFYRFWNYDELQLDGNFSLQELKVLTEAMEKMALAHKALDKIRHDDEADFGPEEW